MTTPSYEIKVCPECGRQTDRWCYEHGLDMVAGERVEVVPAEQVEELRDAAQYAVDTARSYDSVGRLPEFARRLADALGEASRDQRVPEGGHR
jgi:hypothetical protein